MDVPLFGALFHWTYPFVNDALYYVRCAHILMAAWLLSCSIELDSLILFKYNSVLFGLNLHNCNKMFYKFDKIGLFGAVWKMVSMLFKKSWKIDQTWKLKLYSTVFVESKSLKILLWLVYRHIWNGCWKIEL